jgi:hypothetical protein
VIVPVHVAVAVVDLVPRHREDDWLGHVRSSPSPSPSPILGRNLGDAGPIRGR